MSIKLMSAIFDTEFRDLPLGEGERMAKATSLKIVMLAIADHANDEGEAYPGFVKLILKTSLSRQGLTDVLQALRHNGLLTVADEKSRVGSNLYQIDTNCFPKLADKSDNRLVVKWLDQSSGFDLGSQVALNEVVKPLDHNHQLTIIKPPDNFPLEWYIQHNQPVPESLINKNQISQNAINEFESKLGFSSLPWDSSKDWEKFKAWVIKTYSERLTAWEDYADWRKAKGKYDAMNNKQIRMNPKAFMDTGYPSFLAHVSMYDDGEKTRLL